jgi:hypothetical protein
MAEFNKSSFLKMKNEQQRKHRNNYKYLREPSVILTFIASEF